MITIQQADPQQAYIHFLVDGEADAAGTEQLFTHISDFSQGNQRVRLLAEIRRIDVLDSLETLFSHLRDKFSAINRIERYAIVSPSGWIGALAKLIHFFSFRFPVRHFLPEELEKARLWVQSEKPDRGMQLETNLPDEVVGFSIVGTLSAADYEVINHILESQVAKFGEVRLYIAVVHLSGITLAGFWEDFRTGIRFYKHIRRVAILGKADWLRATTKISDWLSPRMEARHFHLPEREQAIDWLLE